MALPVLHLQEIPRDGLSLSCDVLADELALSLDEVQIPSGLSLAAQALKVGAVVHVSGMLTGTVRRQCVRCLKEYDEALQLPVAGEFHKDAEQEQKSEDRGAADETGDDRYAYTGEEIVLDGMLREHLILNAPMQPLCREDCQGLCPVCGQDWNERRCGCREEAKASPFAMLATLKAQMAAEPARGGKQARHNKK